MGGNPRAWNSTLSAGIARKLKGLVCYLTHLGIGLRPVIIARKPVSIRTFDKSSRFSLWVKSEIRAFTHDAAIADRIGRFPRAQITNSRRARW